MKFDFPIYLTEEPKIMTTVGTRNLWVPISYFVNKVFMEELNTKERVVEYHKLLIGYVKTEDFPRNYQEIINYGKLKLESFIDKYWIELYLKEKGPNDFIADVNYSGDNWAVSKSELLLLLTREVSH